MKNRYSITVLLSILYFTSFGQTYPMETVGSPSSVCLVDSYTGWINHGNLSFSGNAVVQNINPSNNLNASGGGNVFFDNVQGTYLQISGFSPSNAPASMDISFDMYGYNAANLNELVLEYSTDGINYTALAYKRLFRNYVAPTPWDIMVSDPLPSSVGYTNLKIRFRQTSSTQQFRIDDIEANFYSTLPIKLLSFSAAKLKGDVQINWTASSTDEHEFFVLESSTDGRKFSKVKEVNVKGIGEFAYNYTDQPSTEKTFYRLKMTDANGRSTYSQIIFIQSAGLKKQLIQNVYPNPSKEVVNTQVLSDRKDNAVVTLTDASGRSVITRNYTLAPGLNNCAVNVSQLNSGLYMLRIIVNGIAETRSILVQ
jgi:hypothetical protein